MAKKPIPTAYSEALSEYHRALGRVQVARNHLKYADAASYDLAYDELKNAEEALDLAIKQVKMNPEVN